MLSSTFLSIFFVAPLRISFSLTFKSISFLLLGPSPSKITSEPRNYFLVGDITFFIKFEGLAFSPPTNYDKFILTGLESYFFPEPYGIKV